jgi:hypothetical protein
LKAILLKAIYNQTNFYSIIYAFVPFFFILFFSIIRRQNYLYGWKGKRRVCQTQWCSLCEIQISKKSKADNVNFSELASVEIKSEDNVSIYKYINVVGKDEPLVLAEVVKGAVTLYNINTQGFSSGFSPSGMGGAPMNIGPMTYDIKNLYILRTGEEKATHLGSNQLFTKNFRTAASVFLKIVLL